MSISQTVTENRVSGKRNAVREYFGHVVTMRDPNKPTKKRQPKSPLQEVFLKRVLEEMGRQGVNPTQLSKRVGAPKQTTLNDILNGADPRLEQVYKTAVALDVPAISLLSEQRTGNIHTLPNVPTISGRMDKAAENKVRDRNKGRR